jgi:hypothetical protein
LLVILPSPHPKAPTRHSTPKVLQAMEHAPTPFLSVVFTFGFVVESIKEFGSALDKIMYSTLMCFHPSHLKNLQPNPYQHFMFPMHLLFNVPIVSFLPHLNVKVKKFNQTQVNDERSGLSKPYSNHIFLIITLNKRLQIYVETKFV